MMQTLIINLYTDCSCRPKEDDQGAMEGRTVPALAPPPKSPQNTAYADTSPRFNPFDKSGFAQDAIPITEVIQPAEITRTDSQVL